MPLIVGISGPSAAGKSFLASYIQECYQNKVSIISFDSYYKDFSKIKNFDASKINFDSPDAFESELLYNDLLKIRQGNSIESPIYDFSIHGRKKETKHIDCNDIVVVEGIMIYQFPEIVSLLDIKVFITADEPTRFYRRSERDIKERGRTIESVRDQWYNTVEPSRKVYIDTKKNIASIVLINNGSNGIDKLAKPLTDKINSLLLNLK